MNFEYDVSIIGSALLEPACFKSILEYIDESDFQSDIARDVFSTMKELELNMGTFDPLLIRSKLASKYSFDSITTYLTECMDLTPTSANVIEYAKLLRADSKMRTLREIGSNLSYEQGDRWQSVAGDYISKLQKVADDDIHTNLEKGRRWMEKFMDEEKKIIENPNNAFCKTGFNMLDKALGGGMYKGGLYIIGARPGMGKTTLGINIAESIARNGGSILFISLEMSDHQIMCKRISLESEIPYTSLMNGELNEKQINVMNKYADIMADRKFAINTNAGLTVDDIFLLTQKVKGVNAVVVDYMGLIKPKSNSNSNRYEDYTNISAELKMIARKLDIPVVVLSQLNRLNTNRPDKRPVLSDLRETGAIEQDADAVIMLHREGYYQRESGKENPENEEIELIIAKNRHGNTGTVQMLWEGRYGRISNLYNEYMDRKNDDYEDESEVVFL